MQTLNESINIERWHNPIKNVSKNEKKLQAALSELPPKMTETDRNVAIYRTNFSLVFPTQPTRAL